MTDRDARLAVTALSSLHQETCKRSHCFTKAKLDLAYFCVLPSDLEDDCVPDSLQVGHGLRLELPYCFKSFFIFKGGRKYLCSEHLQNGHLKVSCDCASPGAHLDMFDTLCQLYNNTAPRPDSVSSDSDD